MVAEKPKVENNQKEVIESPWRIVWKRLKKNKLAIMGLFILIFMVLFSFVGPIFMPFTYDFMDANALKMPPGGRHILGTDLLGRDILTRVMQGGRISLTVGIVAVSIQVLIGSTMGALAGFYGGWVDNLIMRIVDIFLTVPFLPIIMILSMILSDLKVKTEYRIFFVMFFIGVLSWSGLARLVRGQILALREQEFMQAAEALGLKDRKKIFKHLLPNTVPSIIVNATLGIGGAIMTESGLSFLGIGVVPPTPSWGNMVQAAQDLTNLSQRLWLWVPPGLCIFLTVMAINLLGDGLRDALDPKMKK